MRLERALVTSASAAIRACSADSKVALRRDVALAQRALAPLHRGSVDERRLRICERGALTAHGKLERRRVEGGHTLALVNKIADLDVTRHNASEYPES